ncbi:MAG: hypothetical protein NC337_12455 [Roseburia sp.]|nr:hypothetical protein [Roseburia sp.]
MVSNVADLSRHELLLCIQDRKNEIVEKLKNGETEERFLIGGASFTNSEWEKLLKKVDKNVEAVKKQQEEEKKERLESLYEADTTRRSCLMEKLNGTYKGSVPYGYLAQDGVINYNGVQFVCDERSNAICLGDMSNPKDVLVIRLSGGGRLMVNRDNLGELSQAITMFSPEDINLIMRAIADDRKAQEALREIEEDTNSIGDDAEENVLSREQLELLLHSRE